MSLPLEKRSDEPTTNETVLKIANTPEDNPNNLYTIEEVLEACFEYSKNIEAETRTYFENLSLRERLRSRVQKYYHEKEAFVDYNGNPVLDSHSQPIKK